MPAVHPEPASQQADPDAPENFDAVEKLSLLQKVTQGYATFKESRTNACLTLLSLSSTLKAVNLSVITDVIALALSFTVYLDLAMVLVEKLVDCGYAGSTCHLANLMYYRANI